MSLEVKLTASAIVYTNASVKEILTNAQSLKLGPNEGRFLCFDMQVTEICELQNEAIVEFIVYKSK